MHYRVFACDYDGTIAFEGQVPKETIHGLKDVRTSGRKLVLVTGRTLPELISVFPEVGLFDRVVAENGALLYRPVTREEKLLADSPPKQFIDKLRRRVPPPVSVGRVIVATRTPHEIEAVELIKELGLELQIVFNKGAVMILPTGVNKATGFDAALSEIGLSAENAVGVGDGENDHAFLSRCGLSVAVENAIDALKEHSDRVTAKGYGEGTLELIRHLLATDC